MNSLERCLTAWAWIAITHEAERWKCFLLCVYALVPCLWVCVLPCVTCDVCTSLYVLTCCWECAPLLRQIRLICRITGSPKWPGLTGTIHQNIVGALGPGWGFMLRLHLQGLELHWNPLHLYTTILKWSMAGQMTFIPSKCSPLFVPDRGTLYQKYNLVYFLRKENTQKDKFSNDYITKTQLSAC